MIIVSIFKKRNITQQPINLLKQNTPIGVFFLGLSIHKSRKFPWKLSFFSPFLSHFVHVPEKSPLNLTVRLFRLIQLFKQEDKWCLTIHKKPAITKWLLSLLMLQKVLKAQKLCVCINQQELHGASVVRVSWLQAWGQFWFATECDCNGFSPSTTTWRFDISAGQRNEYPLRIGYQDRNNPAWIYPVYRIERCIFRYLQTNRYRTRQRTYSLNKQCKSPAAVQMSVRLPGFLYLKNQKQKIWLHINKTTIDRINMFQILIVRVV